MIKEITKRHWHTLEVIIIDWNFSFHVCRNFCKFALKCNLFQNNENCGLFPHIEAKLKKSSENNTKQLKQTSIWNRRKSCEYGSKQPQNNNRKLTIRIRLIIFQKRWLTTSPRGKLICWFCGEKKSFNRWPNENKNNIWTWAILNLLTLSKVIYFILDNKIEAAKSRRKDFELY